MTDQQQPTSFARIIITPIIVVAAGYLLLGIYGAGIGAAIGIVYILWASRRGRVSKRDATMKTLSDLAKLRADGSITSEEYEAKKAELLRQI